MKEIEFSVNRRYNNNTGNDFKSLEAEFSFLCEEICGRTVLK